MTHNELLILFLIIILSYRINYETAFSPIMAKMIIFGTKF